MPQWSTPERRDHLVRLFSRSGGFCVFGKRPCANPEAHHYEPFTDALIRDWIADDREARHYAEALQRRALHRIPERGALRGTFSAISRDIYYDSQPDYFVEGIGVSGLTHRPFAKVRVPSSFVRLHVDITDAMRGMSKNKRRKAKRYANALPVPVQREVERMCHEAVRHYRST